MAAAKSAVNGDMRANAQGNVGTKTPFAHILSRGKALAKDQQAPPKHADADDDKQQPAADSASAVAADKPAASDDLSAAADQGVSAVLALLASAQATPPVNVPSQTADAAVATATAAITTAATAATTAKVAAAAGIATTAQVATAAAVATAAQVATGAAIATTAKAATGADITTTAKAATAAAIATTADTSVPIATSTATPPTAPPPLDIANLSPADQKLLRSMMAALAAKRDPVAGETAATGMPTASDAASTSDAATLPAIPATAAIATATAPDISEMAAALQRAFGRIGDKVSPKTSPPSADGVTASAPSALGPAVIGTDSALEVVAPKHGGDIADPTASMADIVAPSRDIAVPAFTPITDTIGAGADATSSTTGLAQPGHAEQSVTRHLDMLRDTQWLDNLAHDISVAANQNGQLKFQINPEHLGSLAIEITHGEAGASIRMTTDNDHARAIIADAQPRLIAEVRAQGLRVADSHVDLGNQASGGGNANHRSSSEDHKPFVRTQVGMIEEVSDSPPRDDELYA
jgi:flagellar hook-length control protein FliK